MDPPKIAIVTSTVHELRRRPFHHLQRHPNGMLKIKARPEWTQLERVGSAPNSAYPAVSMTIADIQLIQGMKSFQFICHYRIWSNWSMTEAHLIKSYDTLFSFKFVIGHRVFFLACWLDESFAFDLDLCFSYCQTSDKTCYYFWGPRFGEFQSFIQRYCRKNERISMWVSHALFIPPEFTLFIHQNNSSF